MTPPSTPGGGFRSLAADLRGRSVDELADLLLARPDLARHSVADLSALAAAATTTTSTTRALDSLDRPTLQVLEEMWPATRADFDAYWNTAPGQKRRAEELARRMDEVAAAQADIYKLATPVARKFEVKPAQ